MDQLGERVAKLEASAEETDGRLSALERDVSVLQNTCVSKSELSDAKTEILARIAQSENALRKEISGVDGRVTAVDYSLQAKINGVENGLLAKINEVENGLLAKIDGVENGLRDEINGVENRLRTEINGVEHKLLAEINGVENKLRTEINGVRQDLRTEISQAKNWILFWVVTSVLLAHFLPTF